MAQGLGTIPVSRPPSSLPPVPQTEEGLSTELPDMDALEKPPSAGGPQVEEERERGVGWEELCE